MSQFYEACGIDDVSRGSVLCLFAASFGGAVFTATTLVVCAETDDPGGCRGDTVRIVTRCWHPADSNVAQDVIHLEMCSVLQRWIAKAIKTASEGAAFFAFHRRFVVVHNLS
jgi:predicted metal-binding protein